MPSPTSNAASSPTASMVASIEPLPPLLLPLYPPWCPLTAAVVPTKEPCCCFHGVVMVGKEQSRVRSWCRPGRWPPSSFEHPWRLGPHARVCGVSVHGCRRIKPPSMVDLEDGGGSGRRWHADAAVDLGAASPRPSIIDLGHSLPSPPLLWDIR